MGSSMTESAEPADPVGSAGFSATGGVVGRGFWGTCAGASVRGSAGVVGTAGVVTGSVAGAWAASAGFAGAWVALAGALLAG